MSAVAVQAERIEADTDTPLPAVVVTFGPDGTEVIVIGAGSVTIAQLAAAAWTLDQMAAERRAVSRLDAKTRDRWYRGVADADVPAIRVADRG